ncbi:kynurenine--oxoglutarate transaminase 1-like isoform X2 [Phyllopteryx taeniolatus]|uniref:kynurenine--oxoglutarate transaminase 1-like isoform X2 n=1 Tax=Phyllopteryx taeniolatus TaxID=161469 RepID=UPI002AD3BEE3|nr:kynurenine--oxoglutarate transaminase 1-like isoform X2 [Phyllopteryx taeniolatus]
MRIIIGNLVTASRRATTLRKFPKTTMSRRLHASRTEGVDKNVWVEFTQLASDYKAVNLGQGFPDFAPPEFIQDAFCEALRGGPSMHQYTRAFGHPRLVKSLAKFFSGIVGHQIDPMEDVLVTVGAYQALFCAFQALVDEGDEVIVVEPFFDCYQPMVKMAGGKAVYVPLRPKAEGAVLSSGDWVLSTDELASKFTSRTKAVVINTPNNPLGKVYKTEELQVIADLCVKHDVLCFSDEVYEWLTYDGAEHVKIASLPGMWERTITVGSAGKTFSATGWKVGWAIGAGTIIKHMKTVHQNSVYHCATAAQEAVARGFERESELSGSPDSYFRQLPAALHRKREKLAKCLESVGLKPIMPQGGYFMISDISSVEVDLNDPSTKDESYDFRFVKWLIKEKPEERVDWKKRKAEIKEVKKQRKEAKLIKQLEKQKQREAAERENAEQAHNKKGRAYTVSVALPGSVLDNAQSAELRTYLAGQIARACVIFCADEIVVFDEQGEDVKSVEGEFTGVGKKGQACIQLARLLQYLECPQYLRKIFFPKHQDLQYAGLLNPLDSPHHMRIDEESEYREGVVLDRPTKASKGSLVKCGMRKEVKIDKQLQAGLRVTVRLNTLQKQESKTYKGTVVAPHVPATEAGLYWGYSVRLASCLSGCSQTSCRVHRKSVRGRLRLDRRDLGKRQQRRRGLAGAVQASSGGLRRPPGTGGLPGRRPEPGRAVSQRPLRPLPQHVSRPGQPHHSH